MRRVTLDSNVYISALKFGGVPKRLLKMAGEGEVEIAISEPIVAEVVRVLGDKFAWPSTRLARVEQSLRNLCELVVPSLTLEVVPDDPDDNRIVECAVASGSEAIVTGDKDLLRLKQFGGIRIITPADFIRRSEWR